MRCAEKRISGHSAVSPILKPNDDENEEEEKEEEEKCTFKK